MSDFKPEIIEESVRKIAERIYIPWNTNDDQYRAECRDAIAQALAAERAKREEVEKRAHNSEMLCKTLRIQEAKIKVRAEAAEKDATHMSTKIDGLTDRVVTAEKRAEKYSIAWMNAKSGREMAQAEAARLRKILSRYGCDRIPCTPEKPCRKCAAIKDAGL